MPPKTVANPSRSKNTDASTFHASAPASASSAEPASMTGGSVPQGGTQELTTYVQSLLQQMQARFEEMSTSIVTRIDDMASRIDDLERSIDGLMQQSGVEEGDTAAARPMK
ncbi:hypothetical protein JIQ42_01040 [Leishmania sp. Namibia]|uniref:hypothetical protein n=1 Tax=Leishmania sp. Namibia TaxID=2802991 RepID=UPI001B79B1D6|nr:hypothetical protein JIQ42_01040 [Leishmania sp. Namibia]